MSEDEGIEHESRDKWVSLVQVIGTKDAVAEEVEDEDDDLVDRLSEDHLDRVGGEEFRSTGIWFPIQQRYRGGVGSEGESSEGVHDIDPEQLNGSENGFLLGRGDGGDKGDNDGSDVCRNLELQELTNSIVYATTPHDGLDDRSRVVVHEDDIRSLFGGLSTGSTHRKPDVGSFECGTIIRTVTHNADNLAKGAKGFDEDLLILRGRPCQDLKMRDNLGALLWVKSMEDGAFHDDTSSSVDTALSGDRASGENVVSSYTTWQ